jgi:hypothetical protein
MMELFVMLFSIIVSVFHALPEKTFCATHMTQLDCIQRNELVSLLLLKPGWFDPGSDPCLQQSGWLDGVTCDSSGNVTAMSACSLFFFNLSSCCLIFYFAYTARQLDEQGLVGSIPPLGNLTSLGMLYVVFNVPQYLKSLLLSLHRGCFCRYILLPTSGCWPEMSYPAAFQYPFLS